MKYLLIFLLLTISLFAQTQPGIERDVLGISGSSIQSSFIQLDWTLGEVAITLHKSKSGTLSEGFQQAFVQVKAPETTQKNVADILIVPNPATSFVSIKFLHEIKENIQWELFDITGKSLKHNVFDLISEHEIDISSYPDGMYFLKICGKNISQTHKISKATF